jgi:hypothetical protein
VPGVSTAFSLNLGNPSNRVVHIKELRFDAWGKNTRLETAEQLLPDTETTVAVEKITPKDATFTVPKEGHLYDGLFMGKRFDAVAELEMDGARFSLNAATTRGVVPAIEIQKVSPSPCVRTEEMLGRCALFNLTLANHLTSPFRGTVEITASDFRVRHPQSIRHQLVLGPNEKRDDTFAIHDARPDRETLRELRKSGSVAFSIQALDSADLITKHAVPVVYSNARVIPNLRVGYVPSFDQTLERSLAALGVEAKELTPADIQQADLSAYKTIIIDNRGYEAHPELVAANSHLLDFVNAGGTLIVFYHKSNEWNSDPKKNRSQLAPYPLVLGDERVTDENAPVRFLAPRHPMLNFPNRIRQADFKDWIQERGLYYPKEWDNRYTALFAMSDTGEPPLRGGLLVARSGKGNYIYTSMVWYRQLRAGVPGAYRMFANMISYGRK